MCYVVDPWHQVHTVPRYDLKRFASQAWPITRAERLVQDGSGYGSSKFLVWLGDYTSMSEMMREMMMMIVYVYSYEFWRVDDLLWRLKTRFNIW